MNLEFSEGLFLLLVSLLSAHIQAQLSNLPHTSPYFVQIVDYLGNEGLTYIFWHIVIAIQLIKVFVAK